MSIQKSDTIMARKPSTGYVLSLTFASVATAFIGIALEEGFGVDHNGKPAGALQDAGTLGVIIMFGLMFTARLVFWIRIPQHVQSLVRGIMTGIFALSLVGTAALLVGCTVGTGARGSPGGFLTFTVLAALCQIATLIWLVRYRNE